MQGFKILEKIASLDDPIIEFSRQGVTEENNLGLRYSYVNKNFKICPTYPEFLVEPKNITDEQLKQSSSYRTKGRLPIFTYYYSGNVNTNLKVTPSIWRSAQNKRGLMGNKTCEADVSLLNAISRLGGPDGKLYIFDCRPRLNAFVNRVGGGGYEKEKDYDNATLFFCEIDNIHKARKALNSLYSLCLSNKINDYNNFWTNLEQTGWFQFIYLMLKNANEISKTLQSNHSVLIHCSDGWDRTAQLSSLSQLLLDPFYRTINGFAVLIEKDWLSFGHQFGLRNGFSDKDKQDQASPIFLQFLDACHQLLEQFPNAFEFNERFLLFLAKNYRVNLYVVECNNGRFGYALKLKTDRETLNIKKMCFPLISSSFLRRIGFRIKERLYKDWIGYGYGSGLFDYQEYDRFIKHYLKVRNYEIWNYKGKQTR